MSVEIRPAAPDELPAALAPITHYFGSAGEPSEDHTLGVTRVLPEGRMHAAFAGEAIVGSAGAFAFDLTVPGARVPTAGVTVVGVLPTHRRRGILRRLMRAQLDDVHARGEPLAALWASEGGIYGRFGYGLASLCGELEIRRTHAAFARPVPWAGEARLVPVGEALASLSGVYDRVAAETPGMLGRTEEWWRSRVLDDPEWRRAGGGEKACAVLETADGPEAYALYRVNYGFADGISTGVTLVLEAMGVSPAATAAVWRYLLDIDWMERVRASLLPIDHPLRLLLADPGKARFRIGDGLWLRLVDVEAALAARGYAAEDAVVVEVSDEFCPWNQGRYRLGRDAGRADASADLRLDVAALASVYLGGFGFADLLRAGLVEEVADGAVARADALVRTGRAPWCPENF
ncbi:MAG TPA: GNAT family N-acetyltransferase [Gaiellaceae bacterium]|nr:GNAT family N-acetyltransferase [Gaiellaceae bacterium]